MKEGTAAFLHRHYFGLSCAGLSVLLGVGSWFLWQHLIVANEELHESAQLGETEFETIANSPRLRDALAITRTAVDRIDNNLAAQSNLADNLGYFYKIEEQTQTRLRGLNQLNTADAAPGAKVNYKLIPFTLEVSGSYARVMDFLLHLESGPRLVKIRSFNLRLASVGSTDVILQLDVAVLGKT
ncbi:MAG: type 4a pilus biogenesis protein PilO [Opitutales bacterium]